MANTSRKTAYLEGLRDGLPIGLGYFAVAFSLGIAARNAGLTAFQGFFTGQTVRGLNPVWGVWVQRDVFPCKEAVQLTGILTPCACLYHQVGRLLSCSPVLRKLSQDRLLLCQCGIANIKLNKKRLVFPGLSILGGERVPPPIISVVRQGAMQHATVPLYIVMIKHDSSP